MTLLIAQGKECRRAWEAMPWVLQARAVHRDSEWLQAHLALCSACRDAFAQQRRLRLALSLPTDLRVDAIGGWRRVLERVAAPAPQELPARLRSAPNWLARGLMAAVLIQAVGMALVVARGWPAGPAPAYRTLSDERIPAAAATIRVVPDATMPLTDWNALLHIMRLRVVGGPDASGAYTVAPLSATSTTRHTLQQLRATRGIRLAEAITAGR